MAPGDSDRVTEMMTDNPAPSVIMPRPKKRKLIQAFTAPKDKNTKAILKTNATNSPLLRLPQELRNKIWGYVLGNQLIHIGLREWHQRYTSKLTNPHLYNTICQSSITERKAYELSKTLKNVQTTSMKPEEAKILLCGDRHAACYADIAVKSCDNTFTLRGLDVSALTVCRQVYVDANPILWATNTWSFHMSSAWRLWLENRNAIQRRLLRKVHLCHSAILKFVPKATISAFKGLEELNIDIETWHIIVFRQLNRLLLPAEKITVIAYDCFESSELESEEEQTTFAERVEGAEELRSHLMNLQNEEARKKEERRSAKLSKNTKNDSDSAGNEEDKVDEDKTDEPKYGNNEN
ncbi:hypothetical protein V8E51_011150 [Hyaloscypha variabilis]